MNTNIIPRPEHPCPQWERSTWRNLNGTWEFAFDFSCSAVERRLWKIRQIEPLGMEIQVPFCPESRLSGIGYTDFIPGVAYRKHFELNKEELSGRVLLHFEAVDYFAKVYVNGQFAGQHKGGYTPFVLDITALAVEGDNVVFVSVLDNMRDVLQPKGKQSTEYESHGCVYTRTTGIWQTVWLEFVPTTYIEAARYHVNMEDASLIVEGNVKGSAALTLNASWEGKEVGRTSLNCVNGGFATTLKLNELHLWEVGKGGLYDLEITYGEDRVHSYFGMRTTCFEGRKYLLNGKPLFQRTVLDQGYYPEGIYTAPTDADLVKDIELSKAAGFNGARLHQKVFEPRFLYHCDRLGYLVWGEFPSWGIKCEHPQMTEVYANQWMETVMRDYNHPALIGWCPFNETWSYREDEHCPNNLISTIYKLTKLFDPERPCVDSSGGYHICHEVYDIHDYEQNVEIFKERWDTLSRLIEETGGVIPSNHSFFDKRLISGHTDFRSVRPPEYTDKPFRREPYNNEPIFVSEYGGIRWAAPDAAGWGYGKAPEDEKEFLDRYEGLTGALLDNKDIFGFCYTQLYDVEQEVNGLYTYGRAPKFDMDRIKAINSRKAAIED